MADDDKTTKGDEPKGKKSDNPERDENPELYDEMCAQGKREK